MPLVNPYDWFAEIYDSIYAHLVDYRADVNFLIDQYSLHCGNQLPNTVLDIGCGTGSHLLEFAHRGFRVIGVDSSIVAVEKARLKISGKGRIMLQDMRMLDFGDKVDFAISMFTSLGYLGNDSDIVITLQRLARRLHRSGLLALELWQGGSIPEGYEAEIEVPYSNGKIHRTSKFSMTQMESICLSFVFTIVNPSRSIDVVVTEEHRIQTFEVARIKRLTAAAGLHIVSLLKGGTFQEIKRCSAPADKSDFRIIVFARPDR